MVDGEEGIVSEAALGRPVVVGAACLPPPLEQPATRIAKAQAPIRDPFATVSSMTLTTAERFPTPGVGNVMASPLNTSVRRGRS